MKEEETAFGEASEIGAIPDLRVGQGALEAAISDALNAGLTDEEALTARAAAHLRLAEWSLSQGLIIEGLSHLAWIPDGTLPAGQDLVAQQMAAVLRILDPRRRTANGPETDILARESDFLGRKVFLAVASADIGNDAEAMSHLSGQLDELKRLSPALQERILPQLLEAAINQGDWATSQALAQVIDSHKVLRESPAYFFLIGRVSLEQRSYLQAFDYFAKASHKTNIWGHRARLAMVDMGRNHAELDLADQEQMLERAYAFWRLDPSTIETLRRLETVRMEQGDIVGALNAVAAIINNHAESPEAADAKERATKLLSRFYKVDVSLPRLEAYIKGHESISTNYRFFEKFDVYSEKFADKLLSFGISGRAAQEYNLTREYLATANGLGVLAVPATRLDELRLKEASALLEGGQLERAKVLLEQPVSSDQSNQLAHIASLRARYFAFTGQSIVEGGENALQHSSEYISKLARRYFEDEEWELARQEYLKLARFNQSSMKLEDAVNLYLAAHRSGDAALAKVLGQFLAKRQDFDASLLEDEQDIVVFDRSDLSLRTLEARINRLDEALTSVDDLTKEFKTDQE